MAEGLRADSILLFHCQSPTVIEAEPHCRVTAYVPTILRHDPARRAARRADIRTILLIAHSMKMAEVLCDRVCMPAGKVAVGANRAHRPMVVSTYSAIAGYVLFESKVE